MSALGWIALYIAVGAFGGGVIVAVDDSEDGSQAQDNCYTMAFWCVALWPLFAIIGIPGTIAYYLVRSFK